MEENIKEFSRSTASRKQSIDIRIWGLYLISGRDASSRTARANESAMNFQHGRHYD